MSLCEPSSPSHRPSKQHILYNSNLTPNKNSNITKKHTKAIVGLAEKLTNIILLDKLVLQERATIIIRKLEDTPKQTRLPMLWLIQRFEMDESLPLRDVLHMKRIQCDEQSGDS